MFVKFYILKLALFMQKPKIRIHCTYRIGKYKYRIGNIEFYKMLKIRK